MSKTSERDKIKDLERIAKMVLKTKNEVRPRRPIVIEVCGTPKAGKSSCVSSLNLFLKRNGFTTKVLQERASVCPITDKYNPSFNLWNVFASTAEILEYFVEKAREIDVLLCDRSIFDCLCWFYWFVRFDHISRQEFQIIKEFLTMRRFRSIFDIIYVFKTTPEEALQREYAHLLTRKHGSIMNPKVLKEYNECIREAVEHTKSYFRCIKEIETDLKDQNDVSYQVTKDVLNSLYETLVEQIAYVDKGDLKEYETKVFWKVGKSFNAIPFSFDYRDKVENNDRYVQLVPIAVFTNDNKDSVLVAKKKPSATGKKSPEKNKLLVYFGGHVRKEDNLQGASEDILSVSIATLSREVQEELSMSLEFDAITPSCIWLKNNDRSARHLALCYVFKADFEHFKIKLDDYEFVQTTGTSQSGRVVAITDLDIVKTDDWTKIILKELFEAKIGELDLYQ